MLLTADERDIEILTARVSAWDKRKGPRVGDWVIMQDGSLRRFTHDWGDDIQTTYPKFGLGSFYLGADYMSYSGSLDRAIPKDSVKDTGQTQQATVWFFKHDQWGANRGLNFEVPCKVYRQV